jgi:hypothetical protein
MKLLQIARRIDEWAADRGDLAANADGAISHA